MKLFYTDEFTFPLPAVHPFPLAKYRMLRERLLASGRVSATQLEVPPPATEQELLLAHDTNYIQRTLHGTLTRQETLRIGFPWSSELVERSRRSASATIAAARSALDTGFGANLAGGTHHAFRDHGQGYCVFNDVVMAARQMQADGRVRRVAVIDCDAHQGNGTAAITQDDDRIFTFSVHSARSFPVHKEVSDVDIALPDQTGDERFLEAVELGTRLALERGRPDLVIYLAGADPFHADRLGRLAVSKRGLEERDRFVYEHCRRQGIPVAVTMAGGYSPDLADIVDIYAQAVLMGLEILGGKRE